MLNQSVSFNIGFEVMDFCEYVFERDVVSVEGRVGCRGVVVQGDLVRG